LKLILAIAVAAGLSVGGPTWREALPDYHFDFPRDHFNHPDFQTEWWYYTGNLRAANGHRYGFELVFFREGQRRGPTSNASAWRADDLYLAHLALTDIDASTFHSFRRLNRAGPGLAGIDFDQGRVWNGNWQCLWDTATGVQNLTARAQGVRFMLRLSPRTPPVIHGENGVSQKAEGAGKASYYISFPLLAVAGDLNGSAVTGTAWMDHEWFTHQLETYQRGWDWFSIQLENHSELMLFQLRRGDGSIDPFSAGTYIGPDGRATHVRRDQFHLEPLEVWTSPHTHGRYPIAWRIEIPSLKLSLICRAAVRDQELFSEDSTSPNYWEGAVTYTGSAPGVGYLEMTGYDKPVRF
jgi:predicted secreted hydrolase